MMKIFERQYDLCGIESPVRLTRIQVNFKGFFLVVFRGGKSIKDFLLVHKGVRSMFMVLVGQ